MHADALILEGDTHGTETVSSRDTTRDPRIEPQAGDALAVDGEVREVWEVLQGRIEYGFPGRAASRWLPLIQWQRWARNADVKTQAG